MSKPCPTCNSVMRPVGAGSCPTCGQDSDAIRSIFAARDRLDSVEARYKDLLDQLGVQGHDGATAEIAALRSAFSASTDIHTKAIYDLLREWGWSELQSKPPVAYIRERCSALSSTTEPVAWSLRWPGEKVNAMTTFSSKDRAEAYAAVCAIQPVEVVPLYEAPQSSTAPQKALAVVDGFENRKFA